MSDEGFFALHRKSFEHPLFEGEEYSRRDAWHWLIGEAAWKERRVRIDGQIVQLERGQLAHSLRFLASKWKWSKDRVARFLDTLKTETMIIVDARHGTSLITICNYDAYQPSRDKDRDASETGTATPARHECDKEEEGNKEISKESISPRAARSAAAERFEIFWKVYPKRASASPKKPARLRFEALVKRGVDPQAIIAGAREYAAEQDRLGKTGTQYVKTPEVWLNQEGWTAFEQARAGPPPELSDPIERMKWVRAQMEAENGAQNEPAGRNRSEVLDGGNSVCAANDGRREESKLVFSHARNGGGDGGMAKLFSVPPRLSAGGD